MTFEIKVPALPESVSDATVLDWTKNVGDAVSRDEILVELETDKVVLEVPAPVDGVIKSLEVAGGDTVEEHQILAIIEEGTGAAAATESAQAEAPAAAPASATETIGPAARNLMAEKGLSSSDVTGTGPDGMITKEDVMNHGTAPAAPTAPPAAPAVTQPVIANTKERTEVREPMSRLRQTIAKRLVECQQTAALLTTFNEVNMKPVMDLRSRYKDEFEKKHGTRLGFMSFFTKAAVAALNRFPLVNSHIDGTDIVKPNYNDIGIAVSSPRGLVVPVLRNCEQLSLADIEANIRDFGVRAKDGKLALEELTGGTFTITNGGVFGSMLSTPIINPPQSAILGMHNIVERPVVIDGEIVIRPVMYLALSYDHRIIDGKEAVQFLVTIKDMVEDPARLLLDC